MHNYIVSSIQHIQTLKSRYDPISFGYGMIYFLYRENNWTNINMILLNVIIAVNIFSEFYHFKESRWSL